MTKHAHQSHPDVDRRLARIGGHIEGIRRMLTEEKTCCEVLQQVKAVMAALESTRRIILLDHVRHCLGEAIRNKQTGAAVEEVEQLFAQIW